jgi:hypothetical protein
MTEPISFEEWKKKDNISIIKALEDIANLPNISSDLVADALNEFLEKDYKLYLYQVNNPNWWEVLKDTNSDIRKIRDDWETIVDADTLT